MFLKTNSAQQMLTAKAPSLKPKGHYIDDLFVRMTTSGAPSDEKVVIMMTFLVQWSH